MLLDPDSDLRFRDDDEDPLNRSRVVDAPSMKIIQTCDFVRVLDLSLGWIDLCNSHRDVPKFSLANQSHVNHKQENQTGKLDVRFREVKPPARH